jgi:hypothetical protein
LGIIEVRAPEIGVAQIGCDEVRPDGTNVLKVRANETGPSEI